MHALAIGLDGFQASLVAAWLWRRAGCGYTASVRLVQQQRKGGVVLEAVRKRLAVFPVSLHLLAVIIAAGSLCFFVMHALWHC